MNIFQLGVTQIHYNAFCSLGALKGSFQCRYRKMFDALVKGPLVIIYLNCWQNTGGVLTQEPHLKALFSLAFVLENKWRVKTMPI